MMYYAYIAATVIFNVTQALPSSSSQPISSMICMLKYLKNKTKREKQNGVASKNPKIEVRNPGAEYRVCTSSTV